MGKEKNKQQVFFEFMMQEHDLILTVSQMDEIIRESNKSQTIHEDVWIEDCGLDDGRYNVIVIESPYGGR